MEALAIILAVILLLAVTLVVLFLGIVLALSAGCTDEDLTEEELEEIFNDLKNNDYGNY